MNSVGLFSAFLGGLASFLSPCVLPLIPVYLSMVSGYSAAELREGGSRWKVTARSLAFILGFTLLFSVFSLVFSSAAMLLGGSAKTVQLVSGLLIIVLGLNLAFDFIKILDREVKPELGRKRGKGSQGYLGAFLLGIAFGAGWTPCVGPILSSILLVSAQSGRIGQAVFLLILYSLGLGLPFILAGLFMDRLKPLLDFFKRHGTAVRMVSGLLLAILGILMASGRLALISSL